MTPGDEGPNGRGPAKDAGGAKRRSRFGAAMTLHERVRRRFLVDVGVLAVGVAVAGLYDGSPNLDGLPWAVLFTVLTFVNLGARGLYDVRLRIAPLDELWRIVAATSTSAILVVAARVLADSVGGASTQAVRLWLWATILLGTGRLVTTAIVRRRQRAGHDQLATLIIGADAVGRRIARRLVEQPDLGLRPVGFIDEGLVPRQDRDAQDAPVLGSTADLEAIVAEHGVQHVIVG